MHDQKRSLFSLFQIFAFVAAVVSASASAQSTSEVIDSAPPEIQAWDQQISQAQALLEQDGGPDLTTRILSLEEERSVLSAQRDAALALSRSESLEATIIRGQIELLGPVPESGETDFESAQRNALAEELYNAREPNRAYQRSYLRSAALIADFDRRIADLEYERLTGRAQSPLWPGTWLAFFRESPGKLQTMFFGPEIAPADIASSSVMIIAGLALVMLALGLFVMTLLRKRVITRLTDKMIAAGTKAPIGLTVLRDIAGLGLSFLGLGLLAGGTILFIGVFPGLGRLPLLILMAGSTVVIAQWLGMVIFSPRAANGRLVSVSDKGAKLSVWMLIGLGTALGLETVLELVEEEAPYSVQAGSFMPFLIILFTSASLFLLGRTLSTQKAPDEEPEAEAEVPTHEDDEFLNRRVEWLKLFAMGMMAAAVGSTLMAAIGFVYLARAILLPTIETLLLVAIIVVSYNRLRAVADYVAKRFFNRRNGISPIYRIALGLLLGLVVSPIIALLWGVRPAQLGDFAALLRDGVTVGGATISLETTLVFFGVFIAGYILTRWLQRLVQTSSINELGINDGTRSALVTGIGYIGVIISFVIAVAAAGIDLSNLAIVLGALSVGIGFGMQSVVSNFISGIIMLVERPIKEGDLIEVGGNAGIVDKIAVRATRIQSFDHDDIIIPNSELITGTVRNRTLTDRMTRIECAVGIAYDSDIQKAFDIVRRLADEHENVPDDPAPNVVMEQLGDSALALRLYCFVHDISMGLSTKSQLYVQIVEEFRKAGIEIPFPQSDVYVKTLPAKN